MQREFLVSLRMVYMTSRDEKISPFFKVSRSGFEYWNELLPNDFPFDG